MIQNPNVLVRNFFEKVAASYSGEVSGSKNFTIDTSEYAYLLIQLDVTSRHIGSYLRVSDDAVNVYHPIYDVKTKGRVPVDETYHAMTLNSAGESHLLYIDTTALMSVKVTLRSNPAMTVKIVCGLSNILPKISGEPYNTVIDSEQISADILRTFYPSKRFAEIAVRCLNYGSGASVLDLYNKMFDNVDKPQLVNAVTKEEISAFPITKNGWSYLYADVSQFPSFSMRVQNNSANPTLLVKMTFVDELEDLFSKPLPSNIIDIPNSPIYLEYIGETTSCFKEWRAYTNGTSLQIWNSRNGNYGELADVSSVLGTGVTIDTTELRQVRIIPFDTEHSNNNNAKTSIVLKATDGNFYFCNISSIENIQTASNWKVCKFWEKKNTARKIPTKTLAEVDTHHRYDTTLPDNMYTRTSISDSGLIEYQDVPNLRSLGYIANNKKIVVLAQYDTEGYRVNLWGTTDGGENWVSLYDFSPRSWSHINHNLIPINTSNFASYNNELVLHKVTRVYPTEENKEPEHPYSLTEISVSSISSASACVVTAPNHSLVSGDVVVFTTSANNDWKQLSSSGVSADSIGDNAYFVEKIDDNSFYLRYFRGSYDTNLTCRHIHSVNATNYGFMFCTGERYPDGWMMYLEQNLRNENVDVMTDEFNIYRLNSSAKSIQRCCGALLTSEVLPDLIAFEDEGAIFDDGNERFEIDGREGNLPINSSFGIWKGKLSKIDTFYDNYTRVAASPEPSIWVYQIGRLIVNYLQWGGLMVSTDGGNTFTYIENIGNAIVRSANLINGITQNSICISNGYLIKEKQ